MSESYPRLLVDFNSIREGSVSGLSEDLSKRVSLGDQIILHDQEDEVFGIVKEISNHLIRADIDWDSWNKVEKEPSLKTYYMQTSFNLLQFNPQAKVAIEVKKEEAPLLGEIVALKDINGEQAPFKIFELVTFNEKVRVKARQVQVKEFDLGKAFLA